MSRSVLYAALPVLALLLVLSAAVAGPADAPANGDPLAVVSAIYARALAEHDPHRPPGVVETREEFLAHFTPSTRALWLAAGPPRGPEGPILHVWFGPSALPGTVRLGALGLRKQTAKAAEVEAALSVRGEPRVVVVDLAAGNGGWLVGNVRYRGDDLVSYLKRRLRQ